MLEIVTGTSALNGSTEVTLATLTAWHPLVDVWIDETTDPNVADAIFRLYAVTPATATLIQGAVLNGPGPGKRLLANVPGEGVTIELRAISRRGTTAPVTAALAGYASNDGPGPTAATASVGPLASGVTAMPITGFTWNPLVEAFVQGPSPAAGAEWTLFANIAGFSAPVAVSGGPFIDVNPSNAVARTLGGATSWSLRVAAIAGAMPTVTCSLVSTQMNGIFGTGPSSGTGPGPGPTATQIVYVNKGGNDGTGDGSFTKPFLTIQKALTSITDNSSTKRYDIEMGPGEYADPFQIKPWMGVTAPPNTSGFSAITEITAPADTCGYDPSWVGAGFGVSWFSHLAFSNHQTWDEVAAGINLAQLSFFDCDFNGGATYNSPGTGGVDNITWDNCLSYGGVTVKGQNFFFTIGGTQFLGGTILIDAGPAGALSDTKWLAQNTAVGSQFNPTNVNVHWAAPSPVGFKATADLSNCSVVGTVTLDSPQALYTSTAEGVPPAITLLNGALATQITRQTFANAIGYTPAIPANWPLPNPTTVQAGLDDLAAGSSAVIFNGGVTSRNIQSNRPANQSPIASFKNGILNLSSDTSGASPGAQGAYSTIAGGDQNQTAGTTAFVGGGFQNGAIGDYSSVPGGISNSASGQESSVIGGNTNRSVGLQSITGGLNCNASGTSSVALGANCNASGVGAIALGRTSIASGDGSFAVGDGGVTASGTASVAMGIGTASGFGSLVAAGGVATAPTSIAIGQQAIANGLSSFALGTFGTAQGEYSYVIGVNGLALRPTQFADGAGLLPGLPTAPNGMVQSSWVLLTGSTTASGPGETVELKLDSASTRFQLENGKAYTLNIEMTAAGVIGGVRSSQTLRQTCNVQCNAGLVTITGTDGPVVDFGTVGANSWTFTVSDAGGGLGIVQIIFSTGVTTVAARIIARVRFEEILF